MTKLDPSNARIFTLLSNEFRGQLEKVARFYDSADRLIEEYKVYPDSVVGDACLARFFAYSGSNLEGERVEVAEWTQQMEDTANPPPAPITGLTLSSNNVVDGDPAGTVVGDLFPVGGQAPFSFQITADPDNAFQLVGNQLRMAISADIADTPYSVTIEVTDGALQTFSQIFSVDVTSTFTNVRSIELDGASESFQEASNIIQTTLQADNIYTISFWIKTSDVTEQVILSNNNNPTIRAATEVFIDSNQRVHFRVGGNSTTYYEIRTNRSLNLGTWNHVVISYSGNPTGTNGARIYYDGNNQARRVISNTFGGNISTLAYRFGFRPNGVADRYDGLLDEISIWDKDLNSSEVSELYNAGQPGDLNQHSSQSNLKHWYRFETPSSSSVLDQRGSSDLTLTNITNANFVTDVP